MLFIQFERSVCCTDTTDQGCDAYVEHCYSNADNPQTKTATKWAHQLHVALTAAVTIWPCQQPPDSLGVVALQAAGHPVCSVCCAHVVLQPEDFQSVADIALSRFQNR